jgi:hypothetical protein
VVKGWYFYHEGSEEIGVLKLSLRGGSGVRDAAIYRVSEVGGRTGLRFAYWLTVDRHGLRPRDDKGGENGILGCEFTPGLRVPGMTLLGCRPFGPSPSRSVFPFRNVRHPSVHSSPTTAVGNLHGSLCGCGGPGVPWSA